ncbi:MAG: YcaO-like family protein [Muribaculaceae bacterium]|nr:YcaO-like family protein [Muribaculaceae bacterium]
MSYKDSHPVDTINQIKDILNSLGIKTRETLYNLHNLCFSCRVEIDNYGLESLGIGTNGKGMTMDYSLASGYAELMERLQNKFLVNEALRHSAKIPNGESLHFRFFPDETLIRSDIMDFFIMIKELFPNFNSSEAENFCKKLIGISHQTETYIQLVQDISPQIEWLGVPFARFTKDRHKDGIKYVPIILARANSSTGLCAGNTPHEAILQGINEIFERYVLQRIYLDNITPPSFPSDYFKGTEIVERLNCLKEHDYIYDVKDMSLGKGFPVVGLILTNTKNGTTMFRLGADLNPVIALERCLTEIYQGRTKQDTRFLEYPVHNIINIENDTFIRNKEYQKSLKDGTGFFPKSIFMGTPSYDFQKPILHRSDNSRIDFINVLHFLQERNYTLLVRDNSFLGFCSYQVIIPGLSDQDYRLRDIFTEYFSPFDLDAKNNNNICFERDAIQWPLYNIKAQQDAREFVEKHYPNDDNLRLAPYNTAPQNIINKHLLLFLMAIKNNDYKNANINLMNFMGQRAAQGYPYDSYLACVGSYVYCKSIGMSKEDSMSWLCHFYKTEIINEVISDFSVPNEIMKNYNFPTCFNCDNCPLESSCHYQRAIDFERMIQQIQKANPINQNKLFKTLN